MPDETSKTPDVTSEPGPQAIDADARPAESPGTPSTPAGAGDKGMPDRQDQQSSAWPRLRPLDYVFILLSLAYAALLVVPALPHGIFMGDPGELQLASETLGIMHAPGYPGYASLGYLATLIPGARPTFEVTLVFTLAGLVVLWLCMMCQIRLGLCAPLACLVSLTMLTHPRMWWSLLAPEVYLASLAFQAGSVYLLIKYARLGRRRDLWWAAVCYGVALANRPPLLFMLPFILAGWWIGWRRQEAPKMRAAGKLGPLAWKGSLGLATLGAALPGLYSVGYLYVRDTTQNKYNYLENWNRQNRRLPDAAEGLSARVERIAWHTSGREFSYAFGNTLRGVMLQLKRVRNQFFLYQTRTFFIVIAVIVLGAAVTFRRSPAAAWLLIGMIASALAYVSVYRMSGQAGDLLPMIWACTALFGVALAPFFRRDGARWRNLVAMVVLLVCLPLIHRSATERIRRNPTGDAEEFLDTMDLETLPPNAVICVTWPEAPPVIYERQLRSHRTDIDVLFASKQRWADMLEPYRGRPIFGASQVTEVQGYRLSKYRNIRRIEPVDDSPDAGTNDGS